MKKIALTLLSLLIFTNAQAACNADGCYEYAYEDGTPVEPGSQIMMLKDEQGNPAPQYRGKKVKVVWSSRNEKDYSDKKLFGADDYKKANLQLLAYLYGASEIGEKSCSPEAGSNPKSLSNWYQLVNAYLEAEVKREANFKGERTRLAEVLDKENSQALQTKSIKTQLDLINLSIETISGANGRIPLREKLLQDIKKVIKTSEEEDKKIQDAFSKYVNETTKKSLEIATKACERKKEVKTCDENGACETTQEPDPVKGCDDAIKSINELTSGVLNEYKDAYLAKSASTELNKKLESLETEAKKLITSIPEGDDEFDWKSPLISGFETIEKIRKENGVRCPAGSKGNADKGNSKVEKATSNYLNAVGVTGLYQDDLVQEFQSSWGKSDVLIGQSLFRKEYFAKISDLLNQLNKKDGKDLEQLIERKGKMEKYLSDIEKGLGGSGSTVVGGTATNSTKPATSVSPATSVTPATSVSPSNSSSGSGSSSGGGSGSSSGSSSGNSSGNTNSDTPKTFKEIMAKAEEKMMVYYKEVLSKKDPNVVLSVKKVCGTSVATPTTEVVCDPNKTAFGWCYLHSEQVQRLAKYNACVKSVNEFNAKIDAQLNLSNYVKNHEEYVGIERDPKDNLLKAKMKKKSDGTIYYLPLNYTEQSP